MALVNASHLAGQSDLSLAASFTGAGGSAPATWSADSTLVFGNCGPVTFSSVTALSAIAFATVTFQPGFKTDFGTSTNPIKIRASKATTGTIDYGGDGNAFIDLNAATQPIFVWRPVGARILTLKNGTVTTFQALGGTAKIAEDVVLANVATYNSAAVEIGLNATDVSENIELYDRSRIVLKRGVATGKTVRVRAGCTLEIDADDTIDATIIADGGRIVHIRGNVTIDGVSGEYDARQLIGAYTTAFSKEGPGLTEYYGPNQPTVSRTASGKVGGGSKKLYS